MVYITFFYFLASKIDFVILLFFYRLWNWFWHINGFLLDYKICYSILLFVFLKDKSKFGYGILIFFKQHIAYYVLSYYILLYKGHGEFGFSILLLFLQKEILWIWLCFHVILQLVSLIVQFYIQHISMILGFSHWSLGFQFFHHGKPK